MELVTAARGAAQSQDLLDVVLLLFLGRGHVVLTPYALGQWAKVLSRARALVRALSSYRS